MVRKGNGTERSSGYFCGESGAPVGNCLLETEARGGNEGHAGGLRFYTLQRRLGVQQLRLTQGVALLQVLDELQVQGSPAAQWTPAGPSRARQPAPRASVQALPLHVYEPEEGATPVPRIAGQADQEQLPQ